MKQQERHSYFCFSLTDSFVDCSHPGHWALWSLSLGGDVALLVYPAAAQFCQTGPWIKVPLLAFLTTVSSRMCPLESVSDRPGDCSTKDMKHAHVDSTIELLTCSLIGYYWFHKVLNFFLTFTYVLNLDQLSNKKYGVSVKVWHDLNQVLNSKNQYYLNTHMQCAFKTHSLPDMTNHLMALWQTEAWNLPKPLIYQLSAGSSLRAEKLIFPF